MAFDGYQVEIAPENDEFVASLLEIPTLSAYGDTHSEALSKLEEIYERAKAAMQERGVELPQPLATRPYNGVFQVRVAKHLHKKLVVSAKREGTSLNAMVSGILAEKTFGFSRPLSDLSDDQAEASAKKQQIQRV